MKLGKRMPAVVCALGMALIYLTAVKAAEDWRAPADAAKVKNPIAKTPESVKAGRRLFMKYCMTCHGLSGKGDGPEAAGQDPKPADFTNAKRMNSQTDGELFWKITKGKGKLKPYEEMSPTHTDEEKWNLVNYIRTYAPEAKKDGTDGNKKSDSGGGAK